MKRPELRVKQVTFTYKYLHDFALFSIDQAQQFEGEDESKLYFYVSSILFSACCIEAYLNHVGKQLFPFWDDLERGLDTKGKLQLIAHHENVKAPLDFSRAPDQSLYTLRKIRNSIVHSKTRERSTTRHVGESTPTLMPEWEEACTQENARRLLDDVKDIILKIHDNIDGNGSPFDGELAISIVSIA